LTDGFVDDAFVNSFLLDFEGKVVAKSLASRKVRLFHRVKGGYRIHDFHSYNGSADKLRRQRDLARERKRRQRAKEAVENSNVPRIESRGHAHVTRDVTRSSDKEKEKEKEYVPGTSSVRSLSPTIVVPTKEQRPTDGRDSLPGYTMSGEKRDDLARAPAADQNFRVLVRLTHSVMDNESTTEPTSPDLLEAVKVAAAQHGIRYHHDTFNRAVRSAGAQRHGRRGSAS
jgi:hypothetical protein